MTVFLDGAYLPADQAKVSIFDRGFLYGDALFETVPLFGGRPFLLERHWDRLIRGARILGIEIPFDLSVTQEALNKLCVSNGLSRAVGRLTLSRGEGARGYSPRAAVHPRYAISVHPLPEAVGSGLQHWRMIRATVAAPHGQELTRFKTANKLGAILARAQAEAAGVQEALVMNTAGRVAEASAANVFCLRKGAVSTPSLDEGALEGVTRGRVLELCKEMGIRACEQPLTLRELLEAEGLFLTLSTWGIVGISQLDGQPIPGSPLVEELFRAYWEKVRAETAEDPDSVA